MQKVEVRVPSAAPPKAVAFAGLSSSWGRCGSARSSSPSGKLSLTCESKRGPSRAIPGVADYIKGPRAAEFAIGVSPLAACVVLKSRTQIRVAVRVWFRHEACATGDRGRLRLLGD